ncbi:hypothetical protein BD408DRAFT_409809 [Parasitella parasitica]|nr:hypothetical protein BD408DRAFT_409809 [Parasitella parasitica]
MTFTLESFQLNDLLMRDLPSISSSKRQSTHAPENATLNSNITALESSDDLTNGLLPFVDNQCTFTASTIIYNTFLSQPTFLDVCHKETHPTSAEIQQLDHYRFDQDLKLQSNAAAIPIAEIQPIPMIRTPDLCSVYTNNSYSPSFHMPAVLNEFDALEFNTLLLSQQQQIQEEICPNFYQVQQQESLMVSPLSQFEIMHSSSNSPMLMEDYHCYSGTPPVQSPSVSLSNSSSAHTSTVATTSANTALGTLASSKPRYDCLECHKDFGRPQDLNRHHQSRHSEEKRYRCNCCDRPFARKDALKRHEKSKKGDRQRKRIQQGDYSNSQKALKTMSH